MSGKNNVDYALELFKMITDIVKPQSVEDCVGLFTTCLVRVSSEAGQGKSSTSGSSSSSLRKPATGKSKPSVQ